MKPKISVIMSVYNSQAFLRDSIESILKQSFKEFEFLIVDDNSSDDSYKIIKTFTDERLKIFKRDKNHGLTANLNYLIQKSNSPYIARMDADDIAEPDRLKIQYEYLKSNPEVSLIGTKAKIINEQNKILGEINVPNSFEQILSKIFIQNVFVHPTLMFTKDSILKVGMYDENFKKAQDYHLILKYLAHNLILKNLDQELLLYRIHQKSISKSKSNEQEEYALKVLEWAYKEILKINLEREEIETMRHVYFWHREISDFQKCINLKKLIRNLNKNLQKRYNISKENQVQFDLIYQKFVGKTYHKYLLKLI
ncbi:MAG: hypothetical protein KatS3mg085_059 [Candidatus Dojkabacteria bacterium]|nr:MAG: hypothetical protein KatS3mg085_059 [Candidatus Dojkabacteria bacterium]